MLEERQHEFIQKSCRDYGHLDSAATAVVLEVAGMLKLFSDISNYEVFIDIKVAEEDLMFVVAEQLTVGSYYEFSYLGDFILRENEPAVFEAFASAQVHESVGISLNKKNGGKIITNQRAIPIIHDDEAVAVLILEKSISVLGETPAPSLARSSLISDIMLTLMETKAPEYDLQVREGVMFFDHEGKLLYANKYSDDLYRSFGYTSIVGKHFDVLNLAPQHFSHLLEAYMRSKECLAQEAATGGASESPQVSLFQENTAIVGNRYFRIRFVVLTELDGFVIMFIDDVTQTKRSENRESSYLVTNWEMQHRIKNNLMTVASLLRLQARQCDNEQAREIINLGVNRILSISTTFDLLTRGDSAAVSVQDALQSIRNNHLELMTNSDLDLSIVVSGEDFLLNSEESTTLGMVANELIQNAIKHAFVGRDTGRIVLTTASDDGAKIVQVRDNGVGFDPENVADGSFGLTIIKGLVLESLHGKLTIESNERGTTVQLAFKQFGIPGSESNDR